MKKSAMRLVSINVAAEHADVSTKTVRRRIADGTLPAYRVGRLIKVDLDAATRALPTPMNDAARLASAEAGGHAA